MNILLLCTAFNSLSQRVALVLKSHGHAVTVELAISPQAMTSAAELASPDIIICPFLTKRIPSTVYSTWLTLIVHPGPPGDAGPSALDWTLLGDLGEQKDAETELAVINKAHTCTNGSRRMRSHWGVTVLQAIEVLDAGPVWAFDQFRLDRDASKMSKSDLYRGPITRAAVNAVVCAIEVIKIVAVQANKQPTYPVNLQAPHFAKYYCVSQGLPFQGGHTHDRPLLKASSRDFCQLHRNTQGRLSATTVVQRIRCGDSQPGVLTGVFGTPMFVYNATIQTDPLPLALVARAQSGGPGTVLATRDGAVLVEIGADYPIWISHLRRPKAKTEKYLHPKLPATMALTSVEGLADSLGLLSDVGEWSVTEGYGADVLSPWQRREGTYQQVWVELEAYGSNHSQIGYIHSEFYNGAFSTAQSELLLRAISWTLTQPGLKAIVMLGGSGYFSNGIALNVIEGAPDSSAEGWANINAIDDCVQALLAPAGIVTFAAIRGNAAAGGLALATAADVVLCAESAVLNPHYRGIGLFGSEWHTYSWYERCGAEAASVFTRNMLPMSSQGACDLGLVDHIIANGMLDADQLLLQIKSTVRSIMTANAADTQHCVGAPWTRPLRPAQIEKDLPLPEYMLRNKTKFLAYTFAGNGRDEWSLMEHFQTYRKQELDQMSLDFFHPQRSKRFTTRCTAFVRKLIPTSTPLRFALHRRYRGGKWADTVGDDVLKDEEELDGFDSLGDFPASAVVTRTPLQRPEYIQKSVYKKAKTVDGTMHQSSEVTRSGSMTSSVSSLYSEARAADSASTTSSMPQTPILSLSSPRMLSIANSDEALDGRNVGRPTTVEFRSQMVMPIAVQDPGDTCHDTICVLPEDDMSQEMEIQTLSTMLWSCYYSETGSERAIVGGLENRSEMFDNLVQING